MSGSTKKITNDIYKNKIKKIEEGLWTIDYNQFSIIIQINSKSDQSRHFSRMMNQNELRSLKTQIQLSLTNNQFEKIKELIYHSNSEDLFKEESIKVFSKNIEEIQLAFLYRYYKMKKYKNIIKYFHQQGIQRLEVINNKSFEEIERLLDFFDENIYLNQKSLTFSLQKLQSSSFRIIGENIQNLKKSNANLIFQNIHPFLNAISGKIIDSNILYQKAEDFVKGIDPDVISDAAKIGHSFCNYILKLPNVSFEASNERNAIVDTIPRLKQSVQNSFYTKNLLFFKVQRPAHCYHCISSISQLLTVNNRKCSIYLNEKTLIFCKNGGNFADQIQEIPKSSVKDSESTSLSTVYFIVHPEMLNEEDNSLLEEFINTRIYYVNDTDLPKVIIISTFDFEKSFSFFSNEFRDIKFEINDKEEIEAFYQLTLNCRNDRDSYYLYKSEFPGSGKTYQIHERMKQLQNEKSISTNPKTVFIDSNMKYLPQMKNTSIVHFDLSPELFDEKFNFFDDLWIYCNLCYHILPNGENVNTPKYIFFEAPTLTESQYSEGGSIRAVDFPIAIAKNNIVEVKSSDTKVFLSPELQSICQKVFQLPDDEKVTYTTDLLTIALNMFYPSIYNENNTPHFNLRVINETNLFLNYFCKDLKFDDSNMELSQTLFLLLLRTNFHIWTMKNIFKEDKQPKSFIILAKQSLFSNEPSNKWNLLCFISKDEQESDKWNTKYLIKEISDKINGISDSTLFNYDFFKKLNNHQDLIDIYSNLTDFYDNQIIYFKIISSFFLNDSVTDSFYNKIIDSYIVSKFYESNNNNEIRKAATDSLRVRSPSENDYIRNHPELRKPFEMYANILIKRRNEASNLQELIMVQSAKKKELEKEKGKKYKIDSMIFTITLVKKFIIMILRIILNQPLILEGFTGVGKTAAVHLLNTLVDMAEKSIKWRFHQVDCHGDLLFENIQKDIIRKRLDQNSQSYFQNHVFFFDELNTSPGSCCVINYMNNYSMNQKLAQENERNITFIAAINPYIIVDETTRDLSRVGIKQVIPNKICNLKLCKIAPSDKSNYYEIPDLNQLAYNVRELSESTKMIILKSDPELFLLTENDIQMSNNENYKFLPPDEIEVIKNMISQYYNMLPNIIPKDDRIKFATNAIAEYKEPTIKIILDLLCESFLCIRGMMVLRSILSYRDVKRFMMHFLNFFRKHLKKIWKESKEQYNDQGRISNYIMSTAIPNSIIYSLILSIAFRFSSHTKINIKEKDELISRCSKFNFELEISQEGDSLILDIFSSLLNKLYQINWEIIPKPSNQNWVDLIVDTFSEKIFTKYANKRGIFKLKSLIIHLFAITSCYSVSKHFPDEPIMPCLIIGMPGTSKTLAIQLFINQKSKEIIEGESKKNGKKKNKEKRKEKKFFSTTYLSTRASEADGLNAHYRDCAMFMIENDDDPDSMAICVIDELGLANLNETRPLKLLHYYFDKGISIEYSEDGQIHSEQDESKLIRVMSIAASNYALDFANMNRGILICTDLPSDDDISKSFLQDPKKADKFLKTLWSLTANKQRPDMLALRPLYLLYNIFYIYEAAQFYDICIYLTSIISCHPLEAPNKARELISQLNLEDIIAYDSNNNKNMNNSDLMCKAIDYMLSSEFMKRALCVRTKNYDCLDFIEEIVTKVAEERQKECIFHHIYPTDFKLPSHTCADHALREIFHLITEDNVSPDIKHFFLIIGNASFSDSLLDLLNVPSENKADFDIGKSSLISQNGFSIQINQVPTNFHFIFIMNDEDFEKRNTVDSFPIPLLDRFDQIYFDYNSDDQYKIVKSHLDFRTENAKYLIPDCQKIHDYFTHFIDKLDDIKVPKQNERNPIIIAEESESGNISKRFLGENYDDRLNKKVQLFIYGEDLTFEPSKRIIASFKRKSNSKESEIITKTQDNIKILNPSFDDLYIANYSRNEFYELEDDEDDKTIRKIIFTFNIQSFDGSIAELRNYLIQNNNNNDNNNNGIHAIVFTISPMMESLKDINEKNSIILFDQYIGSSKAFMERVEDDLNNETKYIIIQSNQFSNGSKSQSKTFVHDRHIRHLLIECSKGRPDLNLIIIYHLKDSVTPIGINTSKEWPIFWIESVSNSPLDANDSNTITKCILFKEEYKNNYSKLVRNIFEQLYLDLLTTFNTLLPTETDTKKASSKTKKASSETKRSKKGSRKKKDTEKQQVSKAYPKLDPEIKEEIFQKIIKEEKSIANEKEKNDDFDDFLFKSLFYTLKENSYMHVDLKRLFYEKLKSYLPPYLSFFVNLLISNTASFNKKKEEDSLQLKINFINNLYQTGFIQRNFKRYVTNQFQPFAVSDEAPYFPELIYDQVLILYNQEYTGSIREVLNYIDQYIEVQVSKNNVILNYLQKYFIPYLKQTKPNEIKKIEMIKPKNNFYTAFEELLLLRGGYVTTTATSYDSFHDHLHEYEQNISNNLSYQDIIKLKSMDDRFKISERNNRNLMKNNNKIFDLFLKYQLLNDVCDASQNSTSINIDEINSTNSVELTTMLVLGRPFMDNDIPFIDFISKINRQLGENGADNYIFNRKPFINLIYYEKLIEYCRGERKAKFEINHDDTFFNYHYVFPENAFNEIDVLTEDIPADDLSIIGDVDTTTFSPQLFKENAIFTKTYNLIATNEFPKFKTSSKSYIKDVSNYLYPHEMIRKYILSKCDYTTDSFSEWLFDTDAPLFVRQLYSIFNAIKEQNEEEIVREFTVLSLLLNPWNKDPTVLILFWNYVNENINNFVPKQEDAETNYSRICKNILKAFERTKWNYPLQEGKLYYIYDHKCIKPQFLYEINFRLDNLIFTIAISSESCNKYLKYSNIFKSLPYAHLIKEIPYLLAFSEYLQKMFVIELDTLFVVLSTLNCEDLTKIGEGMKGINLYTEIQQCIETNNEILEKNKKLLEPNQIKNILLKINQTFPGKSSYEQINLYTQKIVTFYNSAFSDFYQIEVVKSNQTDAIKFNQAQLSNVMTNFNIRDLIVMSSFMISYDNGIENKCTIDLENFLKKAFSSKTKFSKKERIELKAIFPTMINQIEYPDNFDFLGFPVGKFSDSLLNNFNLEEASFNAEYFIKLEENDKLYREKTLAMTIKCRPYPDFDSGDNFDALAYLLVILSRSKEKIPRKENQYKYLFYDTTNNNKTRINQVLENLRSLESNVDFQKSRVHIKAQNIIKSTLEKLVPGKTRSKFPILFS